jgi:MFS family permease
VLFSLCSISSGLAGTFATLLMARALMGLAEGPVLPLSQSLMAFASTSSRRGFNMGLIHGAASGLLGALLAPAIIVPLAIYHGWRFAFFFAGIPGLILAFLLARYVREPQRVEDTMDVSLESDTSRVSLVGLLKNRNILLSLFIGSLFITWILAIITFGPSYLMTERQFSPKNMGVFMTILGASTVLGGFAVPAISDRIGRKATMIVFCAFASVAPLLIVYYQGGFYSLCATTFVAYLGYGCFPIIVSTIPAESVPTQYLGRAIAVVIGFGEIIGGVISPPLVGIAADSYGAKTPLLIASVAIAVAFVASFFLRETAPGKIGGAVESTDSGVMYSK